MAAYRWDLIAWADYTWAPLLQLVVDYNTWYSQSRFFVIGILDGPAPARPGGGSARVFARALTMHFKA
jgi:hypothetical protein